MGLAVAIWLPPAGVLAWILFNTLSQAVGNGGRVTPMTFMPILPVLPNALYGLWLMRGIGQSPGGSLTHPADAAAHP